MNTMRQVVFLIVDYSFFIQNWSNISITSVT